MINRNMTQTSLNAEMSAEESPCLGYLVIQICLNAEMSAEESPCYGYLALVKKSGELSKKQGINQRRLLLGRFWTHPFFDAYIYICVCVCIYGYIWIYMHIYVCMCVCMYVYIYARFTNAYRGSHLIMQIWSCKTHTYTNIYSFITLSTIQKIHILYYIHIRIKIQAQTHIHTYTHIHSFRQEHCDIRVNVFHVSREHAEIIVDEDNHVSTWMYICVHVYVYLFVYVYIYM